MLISDTILRFSVWDKRTVLRSIYIVWALLVFGILFSGEIVVGQEATPMPDVVTRSSISYGQVVEETLTQLSFVDIWEFYGTEGDHIIARMVARDGLAPLLGITDAGGDLVARSDLSIDGSMQLEAPENGISEINFVLPETGPYMLVATRVGNQEGTTTGSYSLSLTFVESAAETRPFQEVVFRCGAAEIITAAALELIPEPGDGDYHVSVYGFDGFDPYIRIDVVEADETLHCGNERGDTTGQQITVPDDGEVIVDQEAVRAAQLPLGQINHLGVVRVIIGSRDGAAGRFYVVIEGPSIQPEGNVDRVNVLTAPRARTEPLWLYMLRGQRTRIDPQISFVLEQSQDSTVCDDAGRFDCDQVPSAEDYRFPLADNALLSGDRFSAGIRVESPDLLPAFAQLRSRTAATRGVYSILLIGTLPPLVLDEG